MDLETGEGGREGNANVVNVGANFIVVRASLYYIRCTWTLIRVHRTRLRINDNVHFGENRVRVCVWSPWYERGGGTATKRRGKGVGSKNRGVRRWNKRKKAKRVHRTRHEFGVAPVGISRFTCVFHLSSWGVALASSTYDPPSNGRASNDVTGFPRFPLVPSYRRATTDVACILLFYLLPIVRPRMHMYAFPFSPFLFFFSFSPFLFFFFRTLTRYHAALCAVPLLPFRGWRGG